MVVSAGIPSAEARLITRPYSYEFPLANSVVCALAAAFDTPRGLPLLTHNRESTKAIRSEALKETRGTTASPRKNKSPAAKSRSRTIGLLN
jgi:hypothetical protein